jgi:hypothetical protein
MGVMMISNAPEAKTEETDAEKFVLQGFDAVTETVCVEWRVSIGDLNALREILAPDSDGDPELKMRIYHAYIALFENRTGEWNDDLERREGSLLGYDDWQNDWWIEQRVRRRQG